jgi:hypothetical protein
MRFVFKCGEGFCLIGRSSMYERALRLFQIFGPVAAMFYLRLDYVAMAVALAAGCVASALAAWGTRASKDAPPVMPRAAEHSDTATLMQERSQQREDMGHTLIKEEGHGAHIQQG